MVGASLLVTPNGNIEAASDHITVYEHCDFEGRSKRVRRGEYKRARDAGFSNDSVSSIRVPRGMSVTIYEHDGFGGHKRTLESDEYCLRGNWNDAISSLRVRQTNNDWDDDGWDDDGWGASSSSRSNSSRSNNHSRCKTFSFSGNGGMAGFRFTDTIKDFHRVNNGSKRLETCLQGRRRVEISKQDPNVDVRLRINGQTFRFAPRELADKHIKSWYRKYVYVDL